MKTNMRKGNVTKCLVLALIIVFSLLAFAACTSKVAVSEIAIDESSNNGYYTIGDFNINSLKLVVTYENGDTNTISVEESMLTTEGKQALKTPGLQSVTVYYNNQTTILEVYMVEEGTTLVSVKFTDQTGSTSLAEKYTLVGGSVTPPEAPTIENYTFVGWADPSNKIVTNFSKISESVTLHAQYSKSSDTYYINFVDVNGTNLKSMTVTTGGSITSSDAPSISLSKYPSIAAWEWSEKLPISNVTRNYDIQMRPTAYNSYSVTYQYELNSTISVLGAEGVVYGTNVSSSLSTYRKQLLNSGYEITKDPTNSTTITSNTTFTFIVTNATINVSVYRDESASTTINTYSSKAGTTITLPSATAVEVKPNYVLDYWLLQGSNVKVNPNSTWTVTSTYGTNVKFVPVYKANTIGVQFNYVFSDVQTSSSSDKYTLTITITDDFSLYDSVSYAYISEQFANIIADLMANRQRISSYTWDDNDSSVRSTAWNSIENYAIISAKSGDTLIDSSTSKILTAENMKFTVNLTQSTTGLVFTYDDVLVGWIVEGLDSSYVANTNISIPTTWDDGVHTGDVKKIAIDTINNAGFSGKQIVRIPSTIVEIAEATFESAVIYCDLDLDNLTTIGNAAFENADIYGDVVLSGLTSIGTNAFKNANFNGNDVDLSDSDELTTIAASAFEGAKDLNSVSIADTVTTIDAAAFKNAQIDSLTTLAGVTTLGANAFNGVSLSELTFTKLGSAIGDSALANAKELTTLSIDYSTAIAFNTSVISGSTNIATITLGKNVSELTDAGVLTTLTELTDILVASESTTLYSDNGVVFSVDAGTYTSVYYPTAKQGTYTLNISNATGIVINGTAFNDASIPVLDINAATTVNVGSINTSDKIYAVIANTDTSANATTAFPNSIVFGSADECTIKFDTASGLTYQLVTVSETTTATILAGNTSASSITVPATLGGSNVTKIDNEAFTNYTNLESLTINATLTYWNKDSIDGCSKLTSLSIAGFDSALVDSLTISDFEGNNWYDTHNIIALGGKVFGYNNSAVDENGDPLTVVTKESSAVFGETIPATFFKNTNVTEVVFADSVGKIEANAFENCAALKMVDFNKVSTISEYAFKDCIALEAITFNGTILKSGAFSGCTDLTEVHITGKVNASTNNGIAYYSLPDKLFYGCTDLEVVELTFANNLSTEGSNPSQAFYGCEMLKEIPFNEYVSDTIPAQAFYGCAALKMVDFNKYITVTTIADYAFYSSGLQYVKLTSYIVSIKSGAFDNINDMVVEIPYDEPSGLYSAANTVEADGFDSSTIFFVTSSVNVAATFLNGYNSSNIKTDYPTVNFEFGQTIIDTGYNGSIDLIGVSDKLLFNEEDIIAPEISGYTFVGWYAEQSEQTAITFPLVVSAGRTIYAKYYISTRGSLAKETDYKYVYYVSAAPEIDALDTETIEWHLVENNSEYVETITSFPFITEASSSNTYKLKAKIKVGGVVTREYVFDDVGHLGYAITKYTGTNVNTMYIPDQIDDDTNGIDDIIVVYSGAFNGLPVKDFVLPESTIAILLGGGSSSAEVSTYTSEDTFNAALESISIPSSVEYIADKVFSVEGLKDINFDNNSNLLYATVDAFTGSAWFKDQVEKASVNKGFVVAGRLAVLYVGTGDMVIIEDQNHNFQETTNKSFGLSATLDELAVTIKVVYVDGTIETYSTTVTAIEDSGKYTFTINTGLGKTNDIKFAYEIAADGTTTVFVEGTLQDVLAVTCQTVKDQIVNIPGGVIKLNDNILANNGDLVEVIINSELVYIGSRAFYNATKLATLRYGATNSEKASSKIAYIGEEAFTGTTFYKSESVIVGTIYLKYNNTSGKAELNISETITKIANSAFMRTTQLKKLDLSSSTSLTTIGAFAFYNSGINTIIFPSSITTIGRGAFYGCVSLTKVDLSSTKITEIIEDVFYGDSSLLTLNLPSTVTILGENSIKDCTNLKTLTASGITSLDSTETSTSAAIAFKCGIEDTAWYKTAAAEDDVYLTLGTVLVRYIKGTNTEPDTNGQIVCEITSGITIIAQCAFVNNTDITKVIIPGTVVTIDKYAFNGCTSIKEVELGSGVKYINKFAFNNCSALEGIELPNGLLTIGASAFKGCASLATEVVNNGVRVSDDGLTIPSTVTSIGDSAFEGCSRLTIINLGSNIVELKDNVFKTNANADSALYKVVWNLDSSEIKDDNGNLTTKMAILDAYITGNGVDGSTIFTSTNPIRIYVGTLAYQYYRSTAFETNMNNWINYGWAIYENGDYPEISFETEGFSMDNFKAEYLVEGDIEDPIHTTVGTTVTYTFLGWYDQGTNERLEYPFAVYEDIRLTARWFANDVSANDETFTTTDGASITFTTTDFTSATITAVDTSSSSNPTKLYVPNKITYNERTFPITGFNLRLENSVVEEIILTEAANFNGMTENIFAKFTNLKTLTLCSTSLSTKAIDFKVDKMTLTSADGATTESLSIVYSNDITGAFGSQIIAVLGALENDLVVTIPTGVTEIMTNAFTNSKVKTVYLPNTLTIIGDGAFNTELTTLRFATGIYLTDVTYNAIPKTATIMGKVANYTSNRDYTEVTGLKYKVSGGDYYSIGNVLVAYITDVVTPSKLELPTTINGMSITVLASNINFNYEDKGSAYKITTSELVLPTDVIKINALALRGIDITTTVTYTGSAIKDIASNVFSDTTFYSENSEAWYLGTILIKYSQATGNVTINSSTTMIASGAFMGSQITSITIPNTVTTIGDQAFYSINNLTSVVIPDSVTSIGEKAFYGCTKLETLTFSTEKSALKTIGDQAFANCSSLTSVMLPANTSKIGSSAFAGCKKLATITFNGYDETTDSNGNVIYTENKAQYPSKLTTVGDGVFSSCEALTSIAVPDALTAIPDSAFENCKNLVDVTFDQTNSKLTKIGAQAFYGCTSLGGRFKELTLENYTNSPTVELATIVLPNKLVSVGDKAFENCTSLWGITFNYNITYLGEQVFSGCSNLVKVNIYRTSVPTINSDTFITGGNYHLRIYLNAAASTTEAGIDRNIYEYTNKWSSVWSECASHLYTMGTKPCVRFTDGTNVLDVEAEVIVQPTVTLVAGQQFTQQQMHYKVISLESFEDSGAVARTGANASTRIADYGAQRYTIGTTPITILIVDYDYITIECSNS